MPETNDNLQRLSVFSFVPVQGTIASLPQKVHEKCKRILIRDHLSTKITHLLPTRVVQKMNTLSNYDDSIKKSNFDDIKSVNQVGNFYENTLYLIKNIINSS